MTWMILRPGQGKRTPRPIAAKQGHAAPIQLLPGRYFIPRTLHVDEIAECFRDGTVHYDPWSA